MTSSPSCIALFGGAFDPFHNGHVAAITLLLSQPTISQVWVVPSGDRPDKTGMSPAIDRFEMTRRGVHAVFAGNPRVIVSDIQSRGSVGFATIDLIVYVQREQQTEVGVVIGHELIKDLPKWHRAEELRQAARFLVLNRPGVAIDEPPPGWRIEFLPPFGVDGVQISSTELRQRLAAGELCEGLLPEVVRSYCTEKRLYCL